MSIFVGCLPFESNLLSEKIVVSSTRTRKDTKFFARLLSKSIWFYWRDYQNYTLHLIGYRVLSEVSNHPADIIMSGVHRGTKYTI